MLYFENEQATDNIMILLFDNFRFLSKIDETVSEKQAGIYKSLFT